MKFISAGARPAYLIYATLSLVVIGILSWATAASLKLERADQLAAQRQDLDNRIRLAMYRMESLVNPVLFNEMRREYWQYSPLYCPNTQHVRFVTGEVLSQGSIVQPSPLLINQPPDWILLHFQVSPLAGWRCPEIAPQEARDWPGFDAVFDAWERGRFVTALNDLQYSYTIDELAAAYAAAGGQNADSLLELIADQQGNPPSPTPSPRQSQPAASHRSSDFAQRKQATDLVQRAQVPQAVCEPQPLAEANLLAPHNPERGAWSESDQEDRSVGIAYPRMTPVWLSIAGRANPDLAFLRVFDVGPDVVLQGFEIDWRRFRELLLGSIRDLFPNAALAPVASPDWPDEEPVLSSIPAKLVTNAPEPAAAPIRWSDTHTILAAGWATSLILLVTLALAIRSLVALSERRSQFAYAVTHELRTPLTTFRLYSDMLASGMVSEESKAEYLVTLNDESKRLTDLVTKVLEYSRVENQCVPVSREETTLADIFALVQESCESRCRRSGMRLILSRTGDEPEATFRTDRQLVAQIVGNLIDNACKYGRDPTAPPEDLSPIQVSAALHNGTVQVEVRDRGPGISAKSRAKVFQPYDRGDADPGTATGGIGLGLALCKTWAQLLGGRLELAPTPPGERGACFRLTLPTR